MLPLVLIHVPYVCKRRALAMICLAPLLSNEEYGDK